DVVDTVGRDAPALLRHEVVNLDVERIALGPPLPARILEVPDQLLLLRVDRDGRSAGRELRLNARVDVLELLVPVGVPCAFRGLAVGLEAVAHVVKKTRDEGVADVVTSWLELAGEPPRALR